MRFVLVHGAYHGGWCWDRVRPLLEREGHDVVAPDLPCEDASAGAAAYAGAVVDAMGPSPEPAVLVAHSLGGLVIPVVTERSPVRRMVFVCGLLPLPGMSFREQRVEWNAGFRASVKPVRHDDGSTSWPERGAVETYYHDCDAPTARWAASRLRRQHWLVFEETTPLQRWPDVPSDYVLAIDDRVVASGYGRRVAHEVLGVTPIEIAGGHSPFLSRPETLARLLLEL